jgi:bacterioferritin-associated ferredoxin
MIVCICQRVSDRDIVRVVRDGASSFESVQIETGVAVRCGCCRDCAREVFDRACGEHGVRVHAACETAELSPAWA